MFKKIFVFKNIFSHIGFNLQYEKNSFWKSNYISLFKTLLLKKGFSFKYLLFRNSMWIKLFFKTKLLQKLLNSAKENRSPSSLKLKNKSGLKKNMCCVPFIRFLKFLFYFWLRTFFNIFVKGSFALILAQNVIILASHWHWIINNA